MSEPKINRTTAQRRADRIRAFKQELAQLEQEGVLALAVEERQRLADHHAGVLTALQKEFDVDASDSERQVSWGMRIASTLGAMALAAAALLFFFRYWGLISTPVQIFILIAAPCLAVIAMERVSRKERSGYFTGLIGTVAFACFVLNTLVLHAIFNSPPAHTDFLPWGVFGLVLAYVYGLRMLLAAGLVSWIVFVASALVTLNGGFWGYSGQRPETYAIAGLVVFAAPFIFRHRVRDTFPAIYRLLGILTTFGAVLILSNWGRGSFLWLEPDGVEVIYQFAGFVLAGLAIWVGIRLGMREVVYSGVAFFVLHLYIRLFDWWWDWMPKYLFFLFLGLIAVGLLFVLNRTRRLMKGRAL